MNKHEEFYRALHACLMAHILKDEAEIPSFVARFEKFPDNWSRALACGFYRAAIMRFGANSYRTDDDFPDFYELDAEAFVGIIYPDGIGSGKAPQEKSRISSIKQGFDAVIKYDQSDAPLNVDEMKHMATGLGELVLHYPPFYVEELRDEILEKLCEDITVDLLGKWPDV